MRDVIKKAGFIFGVVYLAVICCLFIAVIIFICFSRDDSSLAKEDFSIFHTDNSVVLVIDDESFYFDTYTLRLSEILEDSDPNGGYLIENGKIYFSATKELSSFSFSLLIYECDLRGESLKLLAEKNGFKTYPRVYEEDGLFFITHHATNAFDDSSAIIDSYNPLSGEYTRVAEGEDCDIYDYIERAPETDFEGDYFVVRQEGVGEKIIDDAFVNSTVYAELMNKYGYTPQFLCESNGHILLVYSIGVKSGLNYPHLIFEYKIGSGELIYKSLVFPYDRIGVEIEYIP